MRAGRDPITKEYLKLTETCDTESQAILAHDRMLAQVEAESHPDRAATVAVLMARWMDVVDPRAEHCREDGRLRPAHPTLLNAAFADDVEVGCSSGWQ